MDDNHRRFLNEALQLAEQSIAEGGGPFGAVVVRDGEVIGRGANGVTRLPDPTAHAEVQAIRDACRAIGDFRLQGCTLYVSCEPCPMCVAAAYWARLDAVYYALPAAAAAAAGFDDVVIREQVGIAAARRDVPFLHVDLPGAGRIFELWRNKSDRIDY